MSRDSRDLSSDDTSAPEESDVDMRVSESFDSSMVVPEEWDSAVEGLGGSIYMTYDWLRTWWEFYGTGRHLRLYSFWEKGQLVGVLPIYLETFGFGILKTRIARVVGANVPPKSFEPPVESSVARHVFSKLLSHLFEVERCDMLSFGPVSERWPHNGILEECTKTQADLVGNVRWESRGIRVVFDLPSTFESYLKSLGSSTRKSRLRRMRKLEKEHSVICDIISAPEEVADEFETFSTLHQKQWQVRGKGGHFESWPKALDYNRLLVERMRNHARLRFFRLLVDGEVVVSRYTFYFGGTLYSELPARVVGDPWDKMGIGATSMIKFNEAVIGQGIAHVDSGLGGYGHKAQLGGVESEVGVWRIGGKGWWRGQRIHLLIGISRLVLAVFNKIWYRRLIPRLPAWIGRSQSMSWLRFDF